MPQRRDKFDPEADFFCVKDFKCCGKEFKAKRPFDKALVDLRKLRQMYDARWIFQGETNLPTGGTAAGPASSRAIPPLDAEPLKRVRLREEAMI